MSRIVEAFGDFVRTGVADVGNAYQRVLMADATIGPPEAMTGDMVTVYDREPDRAMTDWQLQQLLYRQQAYPDTWPGLAPAMGDSGDKDATTGGRSAAPQPATPAGLSGMVLPPEWEFSPSPPKSTAIDGHHTIDGSYQHVKPMAGLAPPGRDEPDMDL